MKNTPKVIIEPRRDMSRYNRGDRVDYRGLVYVITDVDTVNHSITLQIVPPTWIGRFWLRVKKRLTFGKYDRFPWWARVLRLFNPTLHYCYEWDGLCIDRRDPEFEACSCYPRKKP